MEKKNVYIITRHAIANYGSILQAFATEKIFENLGYKAQIIDYIPEEEKTENLCNTYIKNSKFWNMNFITRLIYKIIQKKNIENMNNRFSVYRSRLLKLSKKQYSSVNELKEKLPVADIYCTGSDQVWGKIGNKEYDLAYFLDFALNDKKCISYAASFGKSRINDDVIKKLPSLLKKYDSILVRENTAVNIIKNAGFKDVKEVLDPTLILDKDNWEKMIEPIKENKKYIFIYQLHHNKFFNKYARYISKKTGLELIRVNPSIYFKFKPGKFRYNVNPGQFLDYIKNAEYVLTDSFHGTVFSILFNKKFVDILPNETSTRITSLLELLNLNDRILHDKLDYESLIKEIDYTQVNNILRNEQEKSLNNLKESLRGIN